ncbi:MAG: DUF3137 domain-containing protein [Odoribacter sp.]|nr:DUF3137 domain-containing protein [Odoribacter sp.]
MEQEFRDIYGQLEARLQELEAKRLSLKAKGSRQGILAGGIVFAAGTALSLSADGGTIGAGIAAVIGVIVFFSCIQSKSAEVCAYYKEHIIAHIISCLCKGADYRPGEGIPESLFRKSKLFHTTPDRYHSEDLICGKIDKTAFSCAEIVAEEKHVSTNSKGQRREYWVDIFRGFFFIADFNKDFRGETLVYRNSWIKFGRGQRVKLENPNFEKQFDVFSTDQVEARYILTPNLMERLLELDARFPGKITVSFRDSSVIIAIPDSTNHFEAGIWKCLLKSNKLEREFGTLVSLFRIVHDLNLNLRIWTKD